MFLLCVSYSFIDFVGRVERSLLPNDLFVIFTENRSRGPEGQLCNLSFF